MANEALNSMAQSEYDGEAWFDALATPETKGVLDYLDGQELMAVDSGDMPRALKYYRARLVLLMVNGWRGYDLRGILAIHPKCYGY